VLFLPDNLETYLRRVRYYRIVRDRSPEADALRCRNFLQPGDMAIDVGANIGIYTKLFSDCVGPSGSVHAIEPIPDTFGYLRHNVTKLGLKNVYLYPLAATNRNGIARMSVPLWHRGRKNIYEAHLDDSGDISTRLSRLDDLFAGMKPSFIKIDVEGHEAEVLEGAVELLRNHRPALLVEVTSPKSEKLLLELGYRTEAGSGSNRFFVPDRSLAETAV
jgi:FkbM family methyltransferase